MAAKTIATNESIIRRKTLKERAERLFEFLKNQEEPIYKSDLGKIGFDNMSAAKWIDLLLFLQVEFQSQKLDVQQAGRYTTIKLKQKEVKQT